MISPELQLWRAPDVVVLIPGGTLNIKFDKIFVGGGVVIAAFRISGNENLEMRYVSPKLNAGFRINRMKMSFYLIGSFNRFFDYLQYGANIGIVF